MSDSRYIAGLELRTKLVLIQLAYEASADKQGVSGVALQGTNSMNELVRRNLVSPMFAQEDRGQGRAAKRHFAGFGFTLRGNAAVREISQELLAITGTRK